MKLKHFLLGIVGLPFAAAALIVAVNLGDEDQLPEVKKLLAWEVPAAGLEDNGYLILRGMDAPVDQDAAQVGRTLIDADIAKFRAASQKGKKMETVAVKESGLLEKTRASLCKYNDSDNCLEFYLHQDRAKTQELMAWQKTFIERYVAIGKSANFVDFYPPSMGIILPPFHFTVLASELRRIQAINDIADGKVDEGVRLFVENALISRYLLSRTRTPVGHMVSLALVQHDMRLLSELMEKYPQIAERRTEFAPMLASIAGPEYSFANVTKSELGYNMILFDGDAENLSAQIDDTNSKASKFYGLTRFFFKRNAIENLAYSLLRSQEDAMQASAAQFDDALAAYEEKKQKLMGWQFLGIYLRNPVGKLLVSDLKFLYADYVTRQFDVDGYIRLVALQSKLIADRVPADKVMMAIAQADGSLRNPYNGQNMQWDAKLGELSFLGRQPSNIMPHKAKLFTAHLGSRVAG